MEQIAFRMQLKAGNVAEYKQRHDAIWPELAALLREVGISDYSIFLDEANNALFAVLRQSDDHRMACLSQHPVMRRWWMFMADLTGPVPQTAKERYALATLYCVLMTDYCLTALESAGSIVVEGSFTENPYFSGLLAALRKQQTVTFSDDASGTTCGGWMLHHWGCTPAIHCEPAAPVALDGWEAYRDRWLALTFAR